MALKTWFIGECTARGAARRATLVTPRHRQRFCNIRRCLNIAAPSMSYTDHFVSPCLLELLDMASVPVYVALAAFADGQLEKPAQ